MPEHWVDASAISTTALPEPSTEGWLGNIDTFQDAYDKARERIEEGETRVPTLAGLENVPGGVTGGLAAPGGMTFGIELEVDFPNDPYPYTARRVLAQRLYVEGISQSDEVNRWHFVGGEGQDRPGGEYDYDPNGWVCEFDRTVDDAEGQRGVEIKSQILHDEPRTWANLRRICEIVEELGGQATSRTGLHVNVGGADFDSNSPAQHNSLLRMSAAFDDTIIRMVNNPESGADHRGRGYCRPNYVPPSGFQYVSQAVSHADHYSAVNLGHMPVEGERVRGDSRIEYRVFDSTLDPARIQASVNLALGLTKAALSGDDPGMDAMPAGTTREKFGARRLSGDKWDEATQPFRRLVDLLGRHGLNNAEHRAQFTHMFAVSRWPRT